MTFDEWFVKYPLPAEIDTMDDTDREQWTWALRSAYKTGAASMREWVGLTDEEINQIADSEWEEAFVRLIEAKLKSKNK
jgi:hypothetical protein